MSAAGLYALQAGGQAFFSVADAYKQQAMAELQAAALSRQMEEMEYRNKIDLRHISEQGQKVIAEQTAAYITSGVKLEGSAMTTISDTLANAAEASYIKQRELDYNLTNISMDKAQAEYAASNQQLILNMAAGLAGAATTYAASRAKLQQGTTRTRGPSTAPAPMTGNAVTDNKPSYGLGDAYA